MKQNNIHDFRTELSFSDAASDEPFWDAVYRKAFPDMIGHVHCTQDGLGQRAGIDRAIYLNSGRTIYIDEKKRRADYDDILLEYVSNNVTNSPGWIEKQMQIDYLAYAFMPRQKVFLFPWDMLRRAWVNYKDAWMGKYKKIEADNYTYKTLSLAVPTPVLQNAVSLACVIQLNRSFK